MTTRGERIPKGTLIDGRYEIREHLGEGGMGIVYRARDTKMGQQVALKILLQSGKGERSQEERRRRFMTEIYAINEVTHRNIVQVLEFGFLKDTPFMVMELLNGKDLGRVIHDSPGPLPIDYCVDLMLVLCAAIQACHHKGIIHRDLKPGNVMVIETDSGHGWDVKVLDFSISSISRVAADLTREGQIVGTPRYLSPEQVNGKVLPASDQYAIGLLLYVLLTKQHPFTGLDGLPLIRAIERGQITGPRSLRPEVPETLEQVILKAVNVDSSSRFDRVHDLGRALWPFGSPLGQGLWKKYYFETPPAIAKRNVEKMSTTGVPLLLQMAKGDVPLLNAATVLAHYQSTTAVQGARTIDDPEVRARAERDGGEPSSAGVTSDDPQAGPFKSDGPRTPSDWKWQSSTGGTYAEADANQASRGRQWSSLAAAVVVGAAIAIGGVLGVGRAMRSAAETPHAATAPERQPALPRQPSPAPTAAEPVPTAVTSVGPSAVAGGRARVVETSRSQGERARGPESESPTAEPRRHKRREKPPAEQTVYTKDGVPILPAD